MAKKFLGFIDTKAFSIFHYLPLVGVVIIGYYLSVWLNLMELVISNPLLGWTSLIALYYFVLLIGDNLIHKLGNQY